MRVLTPSTSLESAAAQRQHLFAGLAQQRNHVGQVVLVMGIVGLELADVGIERLGGEGVNAGVDLALFGFLAAQRFLLDDALDFVALLAFDLLAEHPAISRGVGWLGGQYRHGGAARVMKIADLLDGL